MRIVGVSFDSPAENLAWALDQGFPYELWSDENRELAEHFSAVRSPTQPTCDRVTKLLDCEGVLQLDYAGIVTAVHPTDVLEDCEALFGP